MGKLSPLKIPLREARRLAVRQALLDKSIVLPGGKNGAAEVIERLGYVQIDTIAVIERAHHHTLWTRVSDYRTAILDELLAEDRRVFEYWGHGASYLPITDYRYYIPRMQAFPWGVGWIKNMYENQKHLMEEVLARIKKEGPLGSADFKAPDGRKRGPWWDWKPAKTALELLMWRGDLMVTARRNFQRVYDLTERVLPDTVNKKLPAPDEVARFRVRRALSSFGIASEREILDHLHLTACENVPAVLAEMVNSGDVVKLEVEGVEGTRYFALNDAFVKLTDKRKTGPHVHILSPFDNLVIHRRRLERLFGFPYTLECYLPAAKRKYGYFTLPVLWGDEFVARLDPKAERADNTLRIQSIVFEPQFADYENLVPQLVKKMRLLARFNSCRKVSLGVVTPAKLKPALKRYLDD